MTEKTGGEVMGEAYAAFDTWKDTFCEQDTTGFTEELDLLDFINIYDIFNREAITSRAELLQKTKLEATKAERERVLALIEEERQGWEEVRGMGNTFPVESALVRLRKQVRDGKED